MKAPNTISTALKEYVASAGGQSPPTHVADMSWHSGADPLTWDASSARHSTPEPLKGDEQEPVLVDFKQKTPVSKGYDMFVASDKNRSGCEAISVWIAAQAAAQPQADASIISKVTKNADFVSESRLLAAIAATPYAAAEQTEPWKIGAFRYGQTVFVFNAYYDKAYSREELFEEYKREMLRHVLTKEGYAHTKRLDANESFHHLLSAELTSGGGGGAFRLFYAAQIDALDGKGKPTIMRVESGEEEHDDEWYKKALGWYVEGRFAGAEDLCVGEVVDDKLVGMAQLPLQLIAEDAKTDAKWDPAVAYAFLYATLNAFREALKPLADGQVVQANLNPAQGEVRLERNVDYDNFIPVAEEFWTRFGTPAQ